MLFSRKWIKKVFTSSILWAFLLSTFFPYVNAAPTSIMWWWINANDRRLWNVSLPQNIKDMYEDTFKNYQDCLNLPWAKKVKTYNIANGAWGIWLAAYETEESLQKKHDKGLITDEQLETALSCLYASWHSGRFIKAHYKVNSVNPNLPPHLQNLQKNDTVKDFFIEWGFYRLNYGWENYNFINSFYLFNGLENKPIDYWTKSFLTTDESLTMLWEKPQTTRWFEKQWLLHWLKKTNNYSTKFLAYTFILKNPLHTTNYTSKEFNEKLANYFSTTSHKQAFINKMNTTKLWQEAEFNIWWMEVYAIGMQLNPYWKLHWQDVIYNKKYFNKWRRSDMTVYEWTDVWHYVYAYSHPYRQELQTVRNQGKFTDSFSLRDSRDNSHTYNDITKFNHVDFNPSKHSYLSLYFNGIAAPLFPTDEWYWNTIRPWTNNWQIGINYLWGNSFITAYNYANRMNRPKGINNVTLAPSLRTKLVGYMSRSKRSDDEYSYASKMEGSKAFSFYDSYNYLFNQQYTWEQYNINDENRYLKNGTTKTTLNLPKWAFLTTIVWLPSIEEGFDKISQSNYNVNFSINYGFDFEKQNENTVWPLLIMDAFRGSFSPKLFQSFKTSQFKQWNVGSWVPQTWFSSVSEFINDYMKKSTIFVDEDWNNDNNISDWAIAYNDEKSKKPLEVMKANNLWGHYRNIKDYDSVVTPWMQVLNNIETEYISTVLWNQVIAVENIWDNAYAFDETKKNTHYNIIENSETWCDKYKTQWCLSKYWEVLDKNPRNLIKYTWTIDWKAKVWRIDVSFYYKTNANSLASKTVHLYLLSNKHFERKDFVINWWWSEKFPLTYINSEPNLSNYVQTSYGDFQSNEYTTTEKYLLWFSASNITWTSWTTWHYALGWYYNPFINENYFTDVWLKNEDNLNKLKNYLQTNNVQGRFNSYHALATGSASLINLVYVWNGSKAWVWQFTKIYDEKNRLISALWDYDIQDSKKWLKLTHKNWRNLGTVWKRYKNDFVNAKGNMSFTENGIKKYTLPFGAYLLDEEPKVKVSHNATTMKEYRPYTSVNTKYQWPFMWFSNHNYNDRNIFINMLYDFGISPVSYFTSNPNDRVFSKDRTKAVPHGNYDKGLDHLSVATELPNSRDIEENNSYSTYYINNTYNKNKPIFIQTTISRNAWSNSNTKTARGYNFWLNAPIFTVQKTQEDKSLLLTPYIWLLNSDFIGQYGDLRLQLSTKKFKPDGEDALDIKDKVYKKPFWLITFNEKWLVGQAQQKWQRNPNDSLLADYTNDNAIYMSPLNSNPYILEDWTKGTYKRNSDDELDKEESEIEKYRTYYPMKDDFAKAFFNGTWLSNGAFDFKPNQNLLVYTTTHNNWTPVAITQKQYNLSTLINALLLNLTNNHSNIYFKNIEKVNDLIHPKVYFLNNVAEQKYYFLIKVKDNQTTWQTGEWIIPILIDWKDAKIKVFNKLKYTTANRYKETIWNPTNSNPLWNEYFFTFNGDWDLWGLVVDKNQIFEIPTQTQQINAMKQIFKTWYLTFETDIGLNIVHSPQPFKWFQDQWTTHTHSIFAFNAIDNEDKSFNLIKEVYDDEKLNLDKWIKGTEVYKFDNAWSQIGIDWYRPNLNNIAPYLLADAYNGWTQYIAWVNDTVVEPERKQAIQDYAIDAITQEEYDALNIKDWEIESVDNTNKNLWLYKMNYQKKRFITTFNLKKYNALDPKKNIFSTISWEWDVLFASTDNEFKYNTELLTEMLKYNETQNLLSKEYYDVIYKLNWNPLSFDSSAPTTWNIKNSIQILTNFAKIRWMIVDFKWSDYILDKMQVELRCWWITKPINLKNNYGVWQTNDTFTVYNGKQPKECSLDFQLSLPTTPEDALKFWNQKFSFGINIDTNNGIQNALGEKKHTFETKWFNIHETNQLNDIESIPNCKIIAKTKSSLTPDSYAGSYINEDTSVVELDVWYKNPQLLSSNNYNTNDPLLWTKIDLELTWWGQFVNYNAEYYANLLNKKALDYISTSTQKNKYISALLGALKNNPYTFSPKKISLFIWGSHYKKNKFYGKTTFLVKPSHANLEQFKFKVTGKCEFQWYDPSASWGIKKQVKNSESVIQFNFPSQTWWKDQANLTYYNPTNKENGTLFASGFSKQKVASWGQTIDYFIKQYYPSIVSITYNHISPAQIGINGIDPNSKINWNDNGINDTHMNAGSIQALGKWCMTANKKYNLPQNWINGTAAQCLALNKANTRNYEIAHPYKWWSWNGLWGINIWYHIGSSFSTSSRCHAPKPNFAESISWYNEQGVYQYGSVSESCSWWSRWYRWSHCRYWTNNGNYTLTCWNNSMSATTGSLSKSWVKAWESIGQGFGWYYWIGVDWMFEIDKKLVWAIWESQSKVFFDRIVPICMNKQMTTKGRYKTLSLWEKNSVVLVDNGGELNNNFIQSINGKTCDINTNKIKIFPIDKNWKNLYTHNGKAITDENVVDKMTWLPFFMKSNKPKQAPKITTPWWDTWVSAQLDENGIVNLFLHPEIIKAINNNPNNIRMEMRFVDSNKANTMVYPASSVPGENGFIANGNKAWNPVWLNTKEWGWVQVMFRIGFKLNINDIKWPEDIKKHKLYKMLDEGIKITWENRILELQFPILSMSSFNESYANSVNELNEAFLSKNSNKTIEAVKQTTETNFAMQMKYKKFAASSYRTWYNDYYLYRKDHRACGYRSCRDRTSQGQRWPNRKYNGHNQSTNYIRWFNKNVKFMNDTIKDRVISTFYPYTDNTWDQINNKTVMINWIPSIKNIGDNQLVYQGICNVCNQYRGNIFEQHPIWAFNPEHKEKGAVPNIFDYYNDWRNFTIERVNLKPHKPWNTVINISGEVASKTMWSTRKTPYVSKLQVPDEIEMLEILPVWVWDKAEKALKYYWKKAILIWKQSKDWDGNPPALLISGDIIPSDYQNLWTKKIESELVILSEWDIVIGSDVNFINAVIITKGNLIIMPWNTSFKLHGWAIINGKVINYRTNVTDVDLGSYSTNYKTYLKNLELFDLKYPVLFTLDQRYSNSEIFTYIGSVSKTTAR